MAPTGAAEIVFDHVTKRYPGREKAAVEDLSLAIPAGDICILVGPSGAGKTTAMKMVNRLIEYDEGDIRIDGTSIRDQDVTQLRRRIGYVIQHVGLFPHMTIADNIATVPRLLGWSRDRQRTRGGAELLELVGLDAGVREALSRAAFGRGAPAGRAGAGARRRPAADADGRAVWRPGPDHARPPAARVPAAARRGAQDRHLRHARHRRGDQARRPDRDHARGRSAGAVRHARSAALAPGRRFRLAVRRGGSRAQAAGATSARRDRARARRRGRPAGRTAHARVDDPARRALADDVRGGRSAGRCRRGRAADRAFCRSHRIGRVLSEL